MAWFLNRDGIIKHLKRLFTEAKSEIIMVVPFIKTNDMIIQQFEQAEDKGIEVLIVFREKNVKVEELHKLKQFKNITLLHHPNVHAKCYLNDSSLIICSMNLYDHSFKNNREMGVLLDLFPEEVENQDLSWKDDSDAIEEALIEINAIVKASTIVKKSEKAQKNGFKFNALRSYQHRLDEFVQFINQGSDNKVFEINNDQEYYEIICSDYHEKLDLIVEVDEIKNKTLKNELKIRRIELRLKHKNIQLKDIKDKYYPGERHFEFSYPGYKTYWPNGDSIYVYRNQKEYEGMWHDLSIRNDFNKLLIGANSIIQDLKKIRSFNYS